MITGLSALNRYGLGARIGEAQTVDDPRRWLLQQLAPENAEISDRSALPERNEIGAAVGRFLIARQGGVKNEIRAARRGMADIASREATASLQQRVTTDAPFVERLVAFWSNHLCVSVLGGNPLLQAIVGHYERTVIRPHVLGRFGDMVLASAKHPAMLLYLDNTLSIGPTSTAGRRRKRRNNINENYARELLELHTLGVGGGYKQEDVQQLALILTGWTAGGIRADTNRKALPFFAFNKRLHEPGGKRVLKRHYDEAGVNEGERVIEDLCRHPNTAIFVATKLVRHFVSDEPPPHAIGAVVRAFHRSHGDLKKVAKALINLDEPWDPRHRKFRTPQDWLVASLRAIGSERLPKNVLPSLKKLRHSMWTPASPKGYGDNLNDWGDPDGLMQRAELARRFTRKASLADVPPDSLRQCVDSQPGDPLSVLLRDGDITRKERLALALASPAFQWR